MRYDVMDDLEVYIADFDPNRRAYPVRVRLADGGDARGWLDVHDLRDPVDGGADAIEAYGLDLFNRLFHDQLADEFDRAWTAAMVRRRGLRVRLWIDSDDQRLHSIPWELMYYDDSGGLSPPVALGVHERVAFSRYLSSGEAWGQPIQRRPLRMLVVVSGPVDLGTAWPGLVPIDVAAEKRDLRSIFGAMEKAGQLVTHFLETTTPDQLHTALEQGYDVLLYYGHALYQPQLGTRLLLTDATGAGVLYDGDDLVSWIRSSPGKRANLIVLVACNTAASHAFEDESLGNMAARLVQQGGVPAVLAMQRLVEVALARNFTFHLSEYLLQHGVVDVAVNDARRRIAESGNLSWSTPVLYMRNADGRLFAPNAPLEYAQALLEDARFTRWQTSEFIEVEAIPVPQGQYWALLAVRPEDAPPGTPALQALERLVQCARERDGSNLVALLGPPYSGVTTTLRRMAADFASVARTSSESRRNVAIYVPLAGYGQQHGGSRHLEQLIIDTVSVRVPALGEELQRLFQRRLDAPGQRYASPCYVFILDGLDTVHENQRLIVSDEIIRLAHALPEQQFVVSCTHYMFPATLFESARVLLLQSLGERQVLRYLRQRNPQRSMVVFRRIAENRLLDLATDPTLLALIYEQLELAATTSFTRNQLMQNLLNKALSDMAVQYTVGDAAGDTLIELAWQMRWHHRESLSLREVFVVMARIRRERDYSLEFLYQKFRDARLLIDVGRDTVRFVHPALQAYCAALALSRRADYARRLKDVLSMCGVSHRLHWWEDVIYALAGLLENAAPLWPLVELAFRDNSSAHTLLVARCLEAFSVDVEGKLGERQRLELMDACAVRLRAQREPSAERRAQIATALGRLPYPQTIRELCWLLGERVRVTSGGRRYDHTNVRIAAARGLRTMVARFQLGDLQGDDGDAADVILPAGPGSVQVALLKAELQRRDAALLPLLCAWVQAADGRADVREVGLTRLRDTLEHDAAHPLARTVAAFALGDLAYDDDASRLLQIVLCCPPEQIDPDEWNEVVWAAADALTLFTPEQVTRLLGEAFRRELPRGHCLEQVAYIAGRVRAQDRAVIRWLVELVLYNPSHAIKGKALRSLAWFGKELHSFAGLGEVIESLYSPHWEGPLDALMRDLVSDIACWTIDELRAWGAFREQNPHSRETLYLRRKAIEALAWIGDQSTLDQIYPRVPHWPLTLRETWYVTAHTIRARLASQSGRRDGALL